MGASSVSRTCLPLVMDDSTQSTEVESQGPEWVMSQLRAVHEPTENHHSICVVVDTSTLLRDLAFVIALKAMWEVSISIPRAVLHELDGLKNGLKEGDTSPVHSNDVKAKARAAIRVVNHWIETKDADFVLQTEDDSVLKVRTLPEPHPTPIPRSFFPHPTLVPRIPCCLCRGPAAVKGTRRPE